MPSPPAGGRRNRRRVYAAHYPATIFSSWMLAEPFLGLFEDGRLLACGGVTVSNRAMGAANLGNVLTHSGHRGRGLARTVVCSLVDRLERDGFRIFLLGAPTDDPADCRACGAVGFRPAGEQPQVDRKSTRLNSSH